LAQNYHGTLSISVILAFDFLALTALVHALLQVIVAKTTAKLLRH
jgi:hypothetical protein